MDKNGGAGTLSARRDINSGAATFVQSELFARTFREGMALVEETANYLDGEGREASKTLARETALSYAGASMRLTTMLMQIASWLLVLRAVREGEMALKDASDSKYRLEAPADWAADDDHDGLPDSLIRLMDTTRQLYERISRLDAGLFAGKEARPEGADAAGQLQALKRAFNASSQG
jgi:regulator of CtrA degradation